MGRVISNRARGAEHPRLDGPRRVIDFGAMRWSGACVLRPLRPARTDSVYIFRGSTRWTGTRYSIFGAKAHFRIPGRRVPFDRRRIVSMECHATILVISALIAAVVQAVPAAQTDALRRDFYAPEVLEAFLADHGGQPSRSANEAAVSTDGAESVGRPRGRYSETNDRFLRNLDQIGGGNLLRRGIPDWHHRNLDQIGGGNLLREVPRESDRGARNLDQIGGGNLIRGLIDFRRNLDQIGGGNLARSFDALTRETEPTAEKRNE